MDVFSRYFQWNEALVKYYFDSQETQSVILYIDENVLNRIGNNFQIQKDEGLSYKEDFYQSVLLTLEQQKVFLNEYRNHIEESKREKCHMKRWRSDDVFRFGALLAENPASDISCPALSYAIFAILAYQGENNQWKNVEMVMTEYLPNMNLSPQYLIQIFQSIGREFPQFNSGSNRCKHKYVGRIRYQLVLSASQRRDFGCLLARRGIYWDNTPDEGYVHFLQSKILPHVNNRDQIRDRLMESENTPYFISFLENFDPNDYTPRGRTQAESVSLLLYFRYEQGSEIMCGTSTYVPKTLSNDILSIPIPSKTIGILVFSLFSFEIMVRFHGFPMLMVNIH